MQTIANLPWDVTVVEPDNGDVDGCRYRFRSLSQNADVMLEHDLRYQPAGVMSVAKSLGIKHPGVLDFTVVKLPRRGAVAGVYTRNRCTSPAVKHDRQVTARGRAQALAVVSKNANVFTPTAEQDTATIASEVARALGIAEQDVLVSATGVIGVPLPMDKLRAGIATVGDELVHDNLEPTSRAILTTDRGPKVCSVQFGDVKVAAIAKGAGMIEPNMATMLVYVFTNLAVEPAELQVMLERVVARTFNSISVDSDTSTSDTMLVLSTDEIQPTEATLKDFETALACMSVKLGRDIVYQAEGSTKLIEVTVRSPASYEETKRMAKRVVNSPLVKTAINGADPNWGRVVMAIGKPDDQDSAAEIHPSTVTIRMLGETVFANGRDVGLNLAALSTAIRERKTVRIDVQVADGATQATVWGCDLSHDYVKINAEYTT